METLNLVGVVLGIVASVGSLVSLYLQHRRDKAPSPLSSPVPESPPHASAPPSQPSSGASAAPWSGFWLRKVSAVFWGVLGGMAFLEGVEFGETFLTVLGVGFLWLAYRLWPHQHSSALPGSV